ncbi:hypothetical protein [Agromyces cerinus]|uniref:Uncharacterized protein n=1 Tax=Agromyces cerinus subsp. cerinus TaxID=232089 RepID=A0A1N6EL37_9MICO|nr:hypothetical protein [Agromyces cerinus]SIN83756.1 hypothetical protein SAMN05443544_1257 [Agromyces cerinus subsp. cerinus]
MSDPDDAIDSHLLGPDLLPTPFTADEIRNASGSGTTIRILVEEPDGGAFERVNRFSDCDDDGAILERWRVAPGGGVDGEVARGRVTWRELQGHAAFPAATTSRREEMLDLPIGRVECLRFDTRDDEAPDAPVETFWFARALPGMPVRFESPTPAGVVRTTVLAVEVVR